MREIAQKIYEFLGTLLYSPEEAKLDVDSLPPEFQEVGQGLLYFASQLTDLCKFSIALSKGNLDVLPPPQNELVAPLKSLHATLRHLTWQTKQVAKGDYKQHVDFMGDFSDAFNTMIRQLDERQISLQAEIQVNKQKSLALQRHIALFAIITERITQWIIVVNNETKEILFVNGSFRDACEEYPQISEQLTNWLNNRTAEDLEKGQIARNEDLLIETDARDWDFAVSRYSVLWHDARATVFMLTDMTKEREHLRELEGVAYQDALTKAYSRHYVMKRLREWAMQHCVFCICFIDMDGLKFVNDTYGHQAGDEYISSVAKLLREFSSDGIVGRLGGDEFIVLQPEWDEEKSTARLAEFRDILVKQNTEPYYYTRSMSYGVVPVPADNQTPITDLLSAADEKMYAFKKAHKMQRVV